MERLYRLYWEVPGHAFESFSTSLQTAVFALLGRMIRKLKSGEYRLYSRKPDPKTGKRRNLGTFPTLAAAKRHEREVQFFKKRG
jgi:hypothetical protein